MKLKEVKEHFKYAKKVICLVDEKVFDITKGVYLVPIGECDDVRFDLTEKQGCVDCVWMSEGNVLAEIVQYDYDNMPIEYALKHGIVSKQFYIENKLGRHAINASKAGEELRNKLKFDKFCEEVQKSTPFTGCTSWFQEKDTAYFERLKEKEDRQKKFDEIGKLFDKITKVIEQKNKSKENMKAKLTLETAKALYKEGGAGKQFALDNFSEKQLINKKVEKWEDLRCVEGFFIEENNADIEETNFPHKTESNHCRSIFTTEALATSSRAQAMLSQLMKEAGMCSFEGHENIEGCLNTRISITTVVTTDFYNKHKELFDTYLMVD